MVLKLKGMLIFKGYIMCLIIFVLKVELLLVVWVMYGDDFVLRVKKLFDFECEVVVDVI